MRVQNNTLFIHRGDTGKVQIKILAPNGDTFPIADIDEIYFTIEHPNGKVEKSTQNDIELSGGPSEDTIATIWFYHEDTADIVPGTYKYDVQMNYLKNGRNSIFTIVPPSDFVIESVVTLKPFSE